MPRILKFGTNVDVGYDLLYCVKENQHAALIIPFIIPPANYMYVGGGILFSRCPSVFPSVCPSIRQSMTFFFFNILKRQ